MSSINPNKTDPKEHKFRDSAPGLGESILEEMQKEIDILCSVLTENSQKFDKEYFYELLEKYLNNGKQRLLYVNITNFVCNLDEETFATVQTNMEAAVQFIYCKSESSDKKEVCSNTFKAALKLWDHINLARRQWQMFSIKDEQYEEIAEKKLEEKIPHLSKEINAQLISLIALFTALSFLIFGGISSLDNIFDGAKDFPILKIMIIGCIWSICMINLVFIFLFFVSKLTKLSIQSSEEVDASLIRKYPLIYWCNFIFCTILLLCGWTFLVVRYGSGGALFSCLESPVTASLGYIVIVCASAWVAWNFMKFSLFPVYNGWKREKSGWCYYNANGKKARNEWKKDGTKWYYLGKNGYLVTNRIISDPTGERYVDTSGALVKNCNITFEGKEYWSDGQGVITPIEKQKKIFIGLSRKPGFRGITPGTGLSRHKFPVLWGDRAPSLYRRRR